VDWGGTITTVQLPAGTSVHEETRVLEGPPGEFPVRVTLADNGGGEAVLVVSVLVDAPPPAEPEDPPPPQPAAPPADPPPAPEVTRPEPAPPAEQPRAGNEAPPGSTTVLTAVLAARSPDRIVGPTAAESGPVVPLLTGTVTAPLLLAPPLLTSLPITGAGEGIQSGNDQGPQAPPTPPELPTFVGPWSFDELAAAVDQFLRARAAERARVVPAGAVVDPPGPPGPRERPPDAPAPQLARSGSTARVVVLFLAAVLLWGRWSGKRFTGDALRRRLGRKLAAFQRSHGG
jgi:hypothetical protein